MRAYDISSKYPDVDWTDGETRWSALVELDEPYFWASDESDVPCETNHFWVSAVDLQPDLCETAVFVATQIDRDWGFEVPSWKPIFVLKSELDIPKALNEIGIDFQPSITGV
jgi:hypothetical protein